MLETSEKFPDEQQRIAVQGAIRKRCHIPVLSIYTMRFRSQKKIQEKTAFIRNGAKAQLHIC